MTLQPGSRLGAFEVTALIGAGGMGEVYQATDSRLKRQVAIKILPAALADDPDRLARFQREAEVLAALSHPSIAAIHGLEEHDGTKALVMEMVEGPTLADRVARGPLPIDEAFAIARQIADALEAAHDLGIVHRDLKPANIKVRPDGSVKVLDFGLAKAIDPPVASRASSLSQSPTITTPAMTQAGMILGTAAYMSPEQARGRAIDRRTDIWAFGCVLFEMLTGRRAFEGEDVTETLAAVVKSSPSWERLPPLPPVVDLFLRQSLEKDWKKRLGDIREMRLALTGELALAPQPSSPPTARSAAGVFAAVLALAVLATAGVALWPRSSPEPRPVTRFEHVLRDQLPAIPRRLVAVSADGRGLVYQTRAGLIVRSMDALDARLVVPAEGSNVYGDVSMSPDGQWIVYTFRGDLRKVPSAGGAPVLLARVGPTLGLSWTPDRHILYGHASGVMRVSADGGSPETVFAANDGEQVLGPQLLPDGDHILFSVTTDRTVNRWTHGQVAAYSMRTGRRTTLIEGATDARYLPSGHLVFMRAEGFFGVVFDAATLSTRGGAVSLPEDVQPSLGIFSAGASFDVSVEGTLVYVPRRATLRSLAWMTRAGAAVQPITTIPPGTYEDPRLSPDGGRVLVTRDRDIWVFDLASGRSSRITRSGTSLMGVWDPTGTRIAYSSSETAGAVEAWVTAADGAGEPRRLTSLGGVVHVDSWSPDGRLLSIHHHGVAAEGMLTLRMDQEGATPQRLSGDSTGEGAHFSPDGSHVLFVSEESGRRETYVRAYSGPGGQATVSAGGGTEPIWAANGELFYRNLTGDRMYAVSARTKPALSIGTPVLLFDRPFYMTPTGSPRAQYDVSADGRRLLMLATVTEPGQAGRSSIVVVQNWIDELRRLMPAN